MVPWAYHVPGSTAVTAHDLAPKPIRTSTVRLRVTQLADGVVRERADVLAVEEPLEIRLVPPTGGPPRPVAVTMRTPGHDFELASGFLFTEGVVQGADDIRAVSYCTEGEQQYNTVNVFLRPGAAYDPGRLERNFYASSSCGVCGKASIEAIHVRGIGPVTGLTPVVDAGVLLRCVDRLREAQTLFERTGGLHAAGVFDAEGRLLVIREDVGRHNAVDKAIGHAVLQRQVPLDQHILVVSGRASFEIMQKAAVAGIPIVAAVSAPSSLACAVAEAFGLTLVGFVRGTRLTVYAGGHRLRLADGRQDGAGGGPGEVP
jgi:FdhD protein